MNIKLLLSTFLCLLGLTAWTQVHYLGKSDYQILHILNLNKDVSPMLFWQDKLAVVYSSTYSGSRISISNPEKDVFDNVALSEGEIRYKIHDNTLYYHEDFGNQFIAIGNDLKLQVIQNFPYHIINFYVINDMAYVQLEEDNYPVYQVDLQSKTIVDTLDFNQKPFKVLKVLADGLLVAEKYGLHSSLKHYHSGGITPLYSSTFNFQEITSRSSKHSPDKLYIDADTNLVFDLQNLTLDTISEIDLYDDFYFDNDSTVIALNVFGKFYHQDFMQQLNFRSDTLFTIDTLLQTETRSDTVFNNLFQKNSPYFYRLNKQTGTELIEFSNGSFLPIPEIMEGMQSSFLYGFCDKNTNERKEVILNGKPYFIATNGNDLHYYIYTRTNNAWESLAKVPKHQDYRLVSLNGKLLIQGRTNSDYSYYSLDVDNLNPEIQPNIPVETSEWFINYGATRDSADFCIDDFKYTFLNSTVDQEGSLYTLAKNFQLHPPYNSQYLDLYNSVHQKMYGKLVLTKHTAKGEIAWVKTFGSTYQGVEFFQGSHLSLNTDGTISVVYTYYKNFSTENISINHDNGSYLFEIKFNQATGQEVEVHDYFDLCPSNYVRLEAVTKDKAGNTYVITPYVHYQESYMDTTLYSDYDKQFVLLKFSADGEFKFARNILGNHNQFNKFDFKVLIDEATNTLNIINLSTSEEKGHQMEILSYGLNGKLKKVLNIYGVSYYSSYTAYLNTSHQLVVIGIGDTELTAHNHTLNPDHLEAFNFSIRLSPENLKIIDFKAYDSPGQRIIASSHDTENTYILTYKDKAYSILKLNQELDIVGIKHLGRQNDIMDLHLANKHLYFAGEDWKSTEQFRYKVLNDHYYTVSLGRMKNTGFESFAPATIASKHTLIASGKYALAYPNPFYTYTNITLDLYHPYTHYSIYDVQGRVLSQAKEISETDFRIEFPENAQGLYFIKLYSDESEEVLRVMKQ
ncbi:Por secretion system C-terminal sorting domain-containing protein [Lishizhenia tianjinensis]|uniref:Por secretion system C-terminal sorting domain-containing protein n=1 Tax=Lishizhenia tianjinensis TaxID=477690 RepID=A0A1I7BA23_9FLAO|nr:T9SS type A sorting domain-containing protein [Lishizhenia tianjinensis]SFT84033.1 Por secretion system C-terminal sorting domain-containing protein [Lishizhenia tianjinensis]